jgi:NADP-dependent 3-hydroxy acid dehydrogenase YdfG
MNTLPTTAPVAVITGATRGIGRAIATRFAASGFDVLACARSAADLATMAQHWAEHHPSTHLYTVCADVSQKAGAAAVAQALSQVSTHADVLVNNAGVFIPCTLSNPNTEHAAAFEQMMNTNLYSAYHVTQAILPYLEGRVKATIFNLCSIASIMPYSGYSVSKFALLGFSKVLREELKPRNIRVTAVLPGAVLTDSWAGTHHPPSRFMTAADIAEIVWSTYALSEHTVVEDILLRPQLGDL